MAFRTALPTSVEIADSSDTPIVTVAAFDLGANTAVEPGEPQEEMAPGYSRPVGAGYNVTIESKVETGFSDLDQDQVDGELLNITVTYDDGTSVKIKDVGFTIVYTRAGSIGTLEGWTLTGFGYGVASDDVLDISPAV
jgi:hypothetical protein